MDGFAYSGAELEGSELEVVGECSAGKHRISALTRTSRAHFTGAVLQKLPTLLSFKRTRNGSPAPAFD